MRTLVPNVPPELSGPCRNAGRTRRCGLSHDHLPLGSAIRARVRPAVVSLCQGRPPLMEGRRDRDFGPRGPSLSVPGCGQVWQDCRFLTLCGSQRMGRASLLLQGCEDPPSSTTSEGESRWQHSESSGVAVVTERESEFARAGDTQLPVSQQHRRAGPSRHQAPLLTDALSQVLSYRGYHAGGRGTSASNPEGAVLIPPRRLVGTLILQASLGTCTEAPHC